MNMKVREIKQLDYIELLKYTTLSVVATVATSKAV